jgi:hypothetical protein
MAGSTTASSPRRASAGVALALACVLAATAARADPTAADRETARSLMQEGRELRDKGNLKEALRRFKAADDIMHVPTTGLELARVQVSLGLLVEALDTIATLRQTPPKPGDPEPFAEARAKAEELSASLNGRVPTVTVIIRGASADAQPAVTIDGRPLPASIVGLPRSVDPGHHVVTAKVGAAEATQQVDVKEGEQKRVELALAQGAAPAAPAAPETPAPPAAVSEHPDESPDSGAETSAGPPRSHAPNTLTFVALGVAGAGVATGTVTGLIVLLSKKSTLQNECTNNVCGPSSYGDLDSANTLSIVSDIAFVVGGAGAAVAIASLIIGHDQTSEPASPAAAAHLRVAPWFGPAAAGVTGSF